MTVADILLAKKLAEGKLYLDKRLSGSTTETSATLIASITFNKAKLLNVVLKLKSSSATVAAKCYLVFTFDDESTYQTHTYSTTSTEFTVMLNKSISDVFIHHRITKIDVYLWTAAAGNTAYFELYLDYVDDIQLGV